MDLTFRFKVLSHFILVAMILSSVSRLFMLVTHLFLISLMLWFFCWITCSHRRTHTRWADSVMRICRSLTIPVSVCHPWFSSFGSGWLILMMLLHPSIIPSVMFGSWIHVSAWPDVDVLGSWECMPLFIASVQGLVDIAHWLLDHGACMESVDAQTNRLFTPLHVAADHGYLKVAQTLIEHNVNINSWTDVG